MTAISGVEFLIWLLIAASTIAVLTKYLRIPYTVALVLGGLLLSLLRLPFLSPLQPDQRPHWLTPDVILILFLPALVFEGSVKIEVRDLLRDWAPLLVLANVGVLLATVVTGYLVHWAIGLPILIALLFGAIISATDPISVLAIFKDLKMDKRLSVIIEGESLLNDGTAVVVFQILLAGCRCGRTECGKGNRAVSLGSRRGSGSRVCVGVRGKQDHANDRRSSNRDHSDHHRCLRQLSARQSSAFVGCHRDRIGGVDGRQFWREERHECHRPELRWNRSGNTSPL